MHIVSFFLKLKKQNANLIELKESDELSIQGFKQLYENMYKQKKGRKIITSQLRNST